MKRELILLTMSLVSVRAQNEPQPIGVQTRVPDLLNEMGKNPTMQLSQFEQFALIANPTLRQADALTRRSFCGIRRR